MASGAWCGIFPTHVRFYIDGRKNNKYMGSFLDIAIPASGRAPSVYHAAVLGKRHFKSGLVMRRCSRFKVPDTTKYLGRDRFVNFLRAALISLGASLEDVGMFAARSLRVGGATAAAIGKLSQHDIAQLAEVKDQTWLDWYDSRTLERRLGISRALGW